MTLRWTCPRTSVPHLALLVTLAIGTVLCGSVRAGGDAGAYLYANDAGLSHFKGSLTVTFSDPGQRLVVAYGYRNRKIRSDRRNTTEAERELFKPVKAHLREGGRIAHFPHLAPDFYDIVVIDSNRMLLHEGLRLYESPDGTTASAPDLLAALEEQLTAVDGRLVGGWESFFDAKDFIRFETDGERGGFLVQQMRVDTAYAESGAVLEGSIHSIDICWVEKALREDVGWRILTRQQLYRDELPERVFFRHFHVPELKRIRVGIRDALVGPVTLPAATVD